MGIKFKEILNSNTPTSMMSIKTGLELPKFPPFGSTSNMAWHSTAEGEPFVVP